MRQLLVLLLVIVSVSAPAACSGKVKQPAVAGTFYPADAAELNAYLERVLSSAEYRPVDGRLVALIAPHAGYVYSGQVAASAYRHLQERQIDTVILVGASHHSSFHGISVYSEGAWKTPLGTVRINETVARSLLDDKAQIVFSPEPFEKEHSLEVQVPFLQTTLKNCTIVPVLIGIPSRETLDALTRKLSGLLNRNERAILIASTDLSHYHDYATAQAMDRRTIAGIEHMSRAETERCIMSGEGEMCGAYPVILAMAVAQQQGATQGILFRYANSGDVTGDRARVVGYAAMGLYRTALSADDRKELLALARRTVAEYVAAGKAPDYSPALPRLAASGATFVTINRHGALRGCIGNLGPSMPLYRSVIRNAVSAATKDPRFPPLGREELSDIEIEVSVLSPFEPVQDINSIEVGRHGLYLVKGSNAGLLLPQVPLQFGWDRRAFLEQLAAKAGLPAGAWKDGQLYSFTADVIRER